MVPFQLRAEKVLTSAINDSTGKRMVDGGRSVSTNYCDTCWWRGRVCYQIHLGLYHNMGIVMRYGNPVPGITVGAATVANTSPISVVELGVAFPDSKVPPPIPLGIPYRTIPNDNNFCSSPIGPVWPVPPPWLSLPGSVMGIEPPAKLRDADGESAAPDVASRYAVRTLLGLPTGSPLSYQIKLSRQRDTVRLQLVVLPPTV